jgi:hypothetical protein
MTRNRKDRSFDAATELKDAGGIVASAVTEVDGSPVILDLEEGGGLFDTPSGSDGSRFDASVIIDVTAVEIDTGDEKYDIVAQISNSPTFASGIKNAAGLNLAATAVADGGADDAEVGHYELGFTNEQNGVAYRYMRLFTVVAGTIAAGGIDYVAHLAKKA